MTLPTPDPAGLPDFDPHTVPTFPVVPVRVSLDDDGTTKAEFNGQRIDVPPGQDPIAALMEHAAIAATERPLRAIRFAATDTNDRTWPVVVHADGRTWDMSPTAAPQRRSRRTLLTIAAVAALAVALTGAAGTALVLRNNDTTPTTAQAATTQPPGPPGESPVIPVEGWTRRAAWTSPPLVNDTPPLVTDDAVITPTLTQGTDAVLTAMDPDTGGVLWQTPLTAPLDQTPDLATINNADAITATSQNQLLTWTTAGQPLQQYDLPTGALLVPASPAPLVYDERGATALTLQGENLVQRVLPAGATPISADGQGNVYAVDDLANYWLLTDEQTAPSPRRLEAPDLEAAPVQVLTVTGRTLAVLWATPINEDEATFTVTGYGLDTNLVPVWSSPVQETQATEWDPDPTGTWAILGRSSINTETGEITTLPEDWTTTAITSEAAWSLNSDTGYITRPSAKARALTTIPADDAGLPVAIDGDHALILAAIGNTPRLYALQEDTGSPYVAAVTTTGPDNASTTKPTRDNVEETARPTDSPAEADPTGKKDSKAKATSKGKP